MFLERKLPSPTSLLLKFPIQNQDLDHLSNFRNLAKQITIKSSEKIAIITGPCSIHHIESALCYAEKLKKLADYVSETLFLVMRVYVEKPRTTVGWKGFVYDPFLNGADNISQGLYFVRKLFSDLLKMGVPTATEFVNPLTAPFYQDLVTWGFVGARTTTSQIHRELASSLPFPVGFKNTLEGNLLLPIHSIISAKTPHAYLGMNQDGSLSSFYSSGNPNCHLVLRGSDYETNFDKETLFFAYEKQTTSGIYLPIMVDCAHGNSSKNHIRQKEVFLSVVEQYIQHQTPLLGIMIESFLDPGHQAFELGSSFSPTLSITDPCIGWNETEEMILACHEALLSKKLCVNMKA